MDNKRKIFSRQTKNEKKILSINSEVRNTSGIYFLTRFQPKAYIGQAGGIRVENGQQKKVKQGILSRLAQHLSGYQHIDLSIKKHGFYSETNPYGYKINFIEFKPEELDEKERYFINLYSTRGYELLNKTAGGQGEGKEKINEFRPAKGYHDGLKQGKKVLARDLKHIIDLHLDITLKKDTKTSRKAMDKFYALLDEENYKG